MENKLTAKQEKFCQCIADGMNQTDAYRSAYNSGNMSEKTVWRKAHDLIHNGKVTARITALNSQLANEKLWTRGKSVKVLTTIAEGKNHIKESDKIAAVKELNAMHGFNSPTKLEVSTNPLVLILETDESAD